MRFEFRLIIAYFYLYLLSSTFLFLVLDAFFDPSFLGPFLLSQKPNGNKAIEQKLYLYTAHAWTMCKISIAAIKWHLGIGSIEFHKASMPLTP